MTQLYHTTSIANLESILEEGLKEGSYWTSDLDILDYYISTIEDEGEEAAVLTIDLNELKRISEVTGKEIEPDYPGIEEPITSCLDMDEEEVWEAWEESEQTWEDSLALVKTLRSRPSIEPKSLAVLEALSDDIISLDEYLAKKCSKKLKPM